jgi:hypothetical protein
MGKEAWLGMTEQTPTPDLVRPETNGEADGPLVELEAEDAVDVSREAPSKVRLFVLIHQGRQDEDTPLSSIGYPLVTLVRRLLDGAIAKAGNPSKENIELDLWLDSPGGSADAAFKLVLLFQSRASKFRVIVPDYAKSAATLLALGADEIYMTPTAELGPLDAQVEYEQGGITISALDIADSLDHLFKTAMTMVLSGGGWIVQTTHLSRKETLAGILDFVSKFMTPIVSQLDPSMIHRAASQLQVARDYAERLLEHRPLDAKAVARHLVSHYPSHGFVICSGEAEELGLPVFLANEYDHWAVAETIFEDFELSPHDRVQVHTEDTLSKLAEDAEGGDDD